MKGREHEFLEELERLRRETGAESYEEVLLEILYLYQWIVEELKRGRRIVSKPPHAEREIDELEKRGSPLEPIRMPQVKIWEKGSDSDDL